MTTETVRLTQQVREGLDGPEQARQRMAKDMMSVFEKNRALLQRFNALEAMQELADQLNKRGFIAEAKESPLPKTQPKDTLRGYLWLDELTYRVWVDWGVKDEPERHVYEVMGKVYQASETIFFGDPKSPWEYNMLSAEHMTPEEFADSLMFNFMQGTKVKEIF